MDHLSQWWNGLDEAVQKRLLEQPGIVPAELVPSVVNGRVMVAGAHWPATQSSPGSWRLDREAAEYVRELAARRGAPG